MKICFDVDGTLIYDERVTNLADTPRYEVIDLLRSFESLGAEIYVWSGCGIDYAERWAYKLGLTGFVIVVEKGSFIPDIAVDDEEVQLGKVNIKV